MLLLFIIIKYILITHDTASSSHRLFISQSTIVKNDYPHLREFSARDDADDVPFYFKNISKIKE